MEDGLFESYRDGDIAAFEVLVHRHTNSLFAYLARLTGDRETAADLVQESFVKAWKNANRFRTGENFKTWLFAIARNSAIDWFRKKRNIPFSALEGENESFEASIQDSEALPDEIFERAEKSQYLEEILKHISPESRDILLLHYIDEMTFDEIAKLSNESLNTVKSRHRRALLRLREETLMAHQNGRE